MKLLKISLLFSFLILNKVFADDLWENTNAIFEIRNIYAQNSFLEKKNLDLSSYHWGQSVRSNISSIYFANFIGFNLYGYFAYKLFSTKIYDPLTNPLMFPINKDNGYENQYFKFGYSINFNLSNRGILKYGRIALDTPLINTSDLTLIPELAEAIYANYQYKDLKVYTTWVTKLSPEDNNNFFKLGNNSSLPVSAIGFYYDFNSILSLDVHIAQQVSCYSQYLTQMSLKKKYKSIDYKVDFQYGQSEHVYNKLLNKSNNKSPSIIGVRTGLKNERINFQLSLSKINNSQHVRQYQYQWQGNNTKNNRTLSNTHFFSYNTAIISDFNKNKQKAYGVCYDYRFIKIKGLNIGAKYIYSHYQSIENIHTLQEYEYNITIKYDLQKIKNLDIQLIFAKNKTEIFKNTYETKKDLKLLINYYLVIL